MWFQNSEAAEHTVSRESNSLFKCIKVSCSFSLCDPFLCEFCFVFCNSQTCVSLSTIFFETFICICGIHWKMSNWQFFMSFAHRGGPWIVHLQHALPPNEKALYSGYLAPVVLPKVHTIDLSNFCCKLLSVSCDCTQSTGTAKVVNISVLTRSSACYQGYVCVVLSHPNLQTFINAPNLYCVTM